LTRKFKTKLNSVRLLRNISAACSPHLDSLKVKWTSPVYGFFRADVTVAYADGRKYHFFPCAARHCKSKDNGVRRYQDNQDWSSTSNLKKHARHCFGDTAVQSAIDGKTKLSADGSIFEAFVGNKQTRTTPTARTLSDVEIQSVISSSFRRCLKVS
jgi:hypothetical protein